MITEVPFPLVQTMSVIFELAICPCINHEVVQCIDHEVMAVLTCLLLSVFWQNSLLVLQTGHQAGGGEADPWRVWQAEESRSNAYQRSPRLPVLPSDGLYQQTQQLQCCFLRPVVQGEASIHLSLIPADSVKGWGGWSIHWHHAANTHIHPSILFPPLIWVHMTEANG